VFSCEFFALTSICGSDEPKTPEVAIRAFGYREDLGDGSRDSCASALAKAADRSVPNPTGMDPYARLLFLFFPGDSSSRLLDVGRVLVFRAGSSSLAYYFFRIAEASSAMS
jgi:hypothetical protein